ncbi:REJ domain protein (macronuclear) [Tetrahymena thermophila SB210]|uniref:REJ domain protein n=1 Tax=Tetrahymena thermophila (strain SB210) TaxID=312017 RepID=Q22DY8_TETTS|nr:REJ domain protein [Tetrahymena thermophila SB210]EAR83524.2 REJ domain protein [Tetrahymena thermophila SB210]|eukprot:XP_001031187.2 REJ domain protein [Tetrahymena thermophila SB210]
MIDINYFLKEFNLLIQMNQKRVERLCQLFSITILLLRVKADCNDPTFIQQTGYKNYDCLVQTGQYFTEAQAVAYGLDAETAFGLPMVKVNYNCNPDLVSVGHTVSLGSLFGNKIHLYMKSKQQIQDLTISYDFFYSDLPWLIYYNELTLTYGTKYITKYPPKDVYTQLAGCLVYKFSINYEFKGLSDEKFEYFDFQMFSSSQQIFCFQGVNNVVVYVNYQCPLNCSSCDSNQNCLTCLDNYYIATNPNTNLAYCKLTCAPQQYATLPDSITQSQTCQNCIDYCQSCSTDKQCDTCNTNYEFISQIASCLPVCNSNQYRDSNYQCQNCIANCLKCTGPLNCTNCQNPFQFDNSLLQCICPSQGYYLDSNGNCNSCDSTCQTCSGSLNSNCTSCPPNWFSLGGYCYQWCPNNYQQQLSNFECVQCQQFILPNCQTCYPTCKNCLFQQKNKCIDCYETRQIQNGKCVCRDSNDQRDIHFQCSYKNIAVLQATLDASQPLLIIDFGVNLNQIDNLSCSQIFQNPTLTSIGQSATCAINSTQIQVQLSQDSIIIENDQLSLVSGVLSYQASPSIFIDTFYLLNVVQLRNLPPQINVLYDKIQNTCNDITYSLTLKNDASRGFLSLQWSVQIIPSLDTKTQSQVDSIIQAANTQMSQTLTINKYIIPPNSQINLQLNYQLKINSNGLLQYSTQYLKVKQIVISVIQSQYPPIYRYYDLTIDYSIYVQTCDQNGPFIFMEPLSVQIQSSVMPSLNYNNPTFTDAQIEINVKPFTIPIGSILDLNIVATLVSNQDISQTNAIQINPKLTNLFILIEGGSNQLVNYKQPLVLSGIARDYEVEDENSPQGISLTWSCESIVQNNGDYQCYNYLNKVQTIQQTGISTTIPGKTFQPYQTLKFTFQGIKDSRNSASSVLVIFAEIDLPPLTVIFYKVPQIEIVNLNEDINVQLIYSSNVSSDILTYAGAILYDDDVQGVIKFDFYQVKLRIWDYFSKVLPSNPVVQLRFTVYNPAYLMPSMTIINFNINLPPQNCVLQITPANGQAIQTNFQIQMVGCSSNNLPITYQIFYYLNQDDMKSEIQNPKIILRRQIQDQVVLNQKFTILPEGNLIIMAQAMDSKLAVNNSTIQVQVSPLNCDEQTLLGILDNALNPTSNLLPSQNVLNLSIIGEQISKSNPLYNLTSVNQKKLQIIQQLITQSSQLPKSSFLYTYSNKIIAQLQSSLPIQSDAQVTTILEQLNQLLQKQQQMPSNNQLINNNNILLQNLIDSYKILNATTQTVSYDMLPTQINISNSICNQLNNQTLPNQGGIQLQGNLINLDCQQITDKNLQQYMQIFSTPPTNETNIYNAANLVFSQNPYKETASFQNYTQALTKADPNLTISYNQVIQPNISNRNKSSDYQPNSKVVLKFQNSHQSSNNSNMTCIQQKQTTWSKNGCQILKENSIFGYFCYCEQQHPTTLIDDLESILNNKNLETAFSSQGFDNISHFSDFYKFVVFWFLSSLTLVQFGLYFYGNFLDKKYQGGINFYHASSRVFPIIQVNQTEQVQSQQYHSIAQQTPQLQPLTQQEAPQQEQQINKQDEKPQRKDSKSIYSRRSISFTAFEYQKDGLKLASNQDFIFKKTSQFSHKVIENNELKIDNQIVEDCKLQNLEIQKDVEELNLDQQQINQMQSERKCVSLSNFGQNNISNKENPTKLTANISNERIVSHQDENKQENQNSIFDNDQEQQKIKHQKELELKKEQENNLIIEKYMSYPALIRVLVFHDFFSIFFLYDKVLSRSIRFTIYYIRIIHCLSISTIFGQQYNEAEMIMVSIINSIVLQVSVGIITLTHKIKRIGKYLSTFCMIVLCLFYYYLILAVVSGQSAPSSNSKIVSFFIMIGIDFVVVSFIVSALKMKIISHMLNKAKRIKIIVKLFYLLNFVDIIQNLSV